MWLKVDKLQHCSSCTCSVSDGFSKLLHLQRNKSAVFLDKLHATGDEAVSLSTVPRYCEEYRDPVKPVVMPKSCRNLGNSKCDFMHSLSIV